MPARKSPMERFWSHVRLSDGCWEWTGAMNDRGYGKFNVADRMVTASRFVFENIVRKLKPYPIEVIDHLCLNPQCVRPDHLEAITSKENNDRGFNGRKHKDRCLRGHLFTSENTYIELGRGSRVCRACRAYRKRNKQQSEKEPK